MERNLIIYHRGCWDGFTAAWVTHRALGSGELYAAHYGEPPPDVRDRKVYIVDFSYPRAVLDKMVADCDSLVVLDHHKTAEEDLRGHPHAIFDGEESGASLAWRHFHPGEEAPKLVQYVKDRDLWRWALPDSRAVSEWLRLADFDLQVWDGLAEMLDTSLMSVVTVGNALRRATEQRVKGAAAHPIKLTIGGVEFDATNATTDFSEVAGTLSRRTGAGAAWFHRQDGRVQFSLRSEERTVDVSAVAKRYGGGGHAAAAAFDVSLQGFLAILGGADERQTGSAYQWCCLRCGGGLSESLCVDCGAMNYSVCVPGWFGEGVAKEYQSRWKDGHKQAIREVREAMESDERERRGPRLAKVVWGEPA
jgi:oligoribonuclease NrnB/cAMP/cGMP phosphodiesterase (DHH superfamily)